MKTLIVEDKTQLADAIKEYLRMRKIEAVVKYDGIDGYKEALKDIYDVIVLDLMLPNKDGLSIIKDLRMMKIDTPIIVLTAKSLTEEKVECLVAGADDYLTKPFVLEELLARLLALTRRKGNIVPNKIEYENISLDKLTHVISCGNNSLQLSVKEFDIMEILMLNAGVIVEKRRILEKVWGIESDTYYNSCEVYISFLRKKLQGMKSNVKIKSIRNVGYSLTSKDND